MATEKLYWPDPFALTFSGARARLATWTPAGGAAGREHPAQPSVILDRTLFYPESGGQMADVGTLTIAGRTLPVRDVQIDDAGDIHHLLGETPSQLGEIANDLADDLARGSVDVSGAIDRSRRLDHMAQHTAQHALSRALVEVARAETISARLGAGGCTIDVDGGVDDRDLARAEDLVNSVVTGDVTVRQLFPTPEELARIPLRKAPSVDHDVRIIEIEGFDFTPCGGTHCTRTGQIGLVRVVGLERTVLRMRDAEKAKRAGWRVTFHAGRRALDDVRAKDAVLAGLARDFTCGMLDVGAAVGKLQGELKARTDLLATTRGELVELLAERALAAHPPDPSGTTRVVVVRREGGGGGGEGLLSLLRTLAGRLASRPDVVAFCAGTSRGDAAASGAAGEGGSPRSEWIVVVQRGASADFDCGKWVKNTAGAHGGRGGGRPERAEGRLPGSVAIEAIATGAIGGD
jgi:alanyl-tRNA synthetase